MTKLSLVATHTSACTYHFKSTEHGGWALCTVNDVTGELLITSDWGNWSHRWDPRHLGSPSLTHFIVDRRGYDYLACKLLSRDDTWVLDSDATINKWRRQLCVQRREQQLDAVIAREIWDRIGSLVDDEQNEAIFIKHACDIEGFLAWISQTPWEDVEHRYSYTYRLLVDVLLPVLAAACAETVRARHEPA